MKPAARARGVTMIEVLITIVIVSFGLLGLAGLQSRLQLAELESYQRSQALILVNDMASRIAANRHQASDYVTSGSDYFGAGMDCPDADDSEDRREADQREWCQALGSLVSGRGCVHAPATDQYLVTVAWQGMVPTDAPPAAVTCGADLYDAATDDDGATDSPCVEDRCRRVVTAVLYLGSL